MKKYLTLAASALLLAACSEKPGYEINGTVANTDLNGKYDYLYEYGVQDAAPMDSALVQNGTFTFKGTQNAPALRKLAFAEDVVEPKRAASGENAPFTSIFVLENGKLQAILDEAASKGSNLHDLADYAVVQINATHPSMIIPEFIRLLGERGIDLDEAAEIVSHV